MTETAAKTGSPAPPAEEARTGESAAPDLATPDGDGNGGRPVAADATGPGGSAADSAGADADRAEAPLSESPLDESPVDESPLDESPLDESALSRDEPASAVVDDAGGDPVAPAFAAAPEPTPEAPAPRWSAVDPPGPELPAATAPAGDPARDPDRRPAFTRPPGMLPPPDQPTGPTPVVPAGKPAPGVPPSAALSGATLTPSGSFPTVTGVAPVSAPPRSPGRSAPDGVTVRPMGPTGTGTQPAEGIRPRPAATPRGPRRARLAVKRVDPWSVMKFSFAVSLVLFIVVVVATSVLYLALNQMGVFESINDTVAELVESGGGESGAAFQITARGVIGTAAVFGALNVLLFTSLATLGAFIYNVCADLVGGVEMTLAERD